LLALTFSAYPLGFFAANIFLKYFYPPRMNHTGAVHSTENTLAKVKNTFTALFLRILDNNFFLLDTCS